MNRIQELAIDRHRELGAHPNGRGETQFCVWAPHADQVCVEMVGGSAPHMMRKDEAGFHRLAVGGVGPGDRYWYRVNLGPPRPDPASRYQPEGVHGPSEVVGSEFDWHDQNWRGHHRDDLVIYELHLGALTEAGTFRSAIDRLAELADLGVTAIELMPVAASAGRWNWGYDGVALFAPSNAYGTPDDFRRLVDAAHQTGLSVFLDVVYNHVGPEGNYLGDFGPYLSQKHHTVWGQAPNFDDPEHGDFVRQFFIANAIHWLDEYHLDGLRVDAIHCMIDEREPHVVAEMSAAIARWSRDARRQVTLIAESNVYDPEMTEPLESDGIGFDAMWCDDFLHSTFAVVRPDEQLCSREYRPRTDLDHTLRCGYVYEGTLRETWRRTEPNGRVDSRGLVYSIQNHDFIGNHPLGKRLHQLTSHDAHRAAAALMILFPAIPMLFMGEEFACERPFCFFVDFSEDHLRESVRKGRREEYPQHEWDHGVEPTDPEAFLSAKIGPLSSGNAETSRWYRDLIALRKQCRASGVLNDEGLDVTSDLQQNVYRLRYRHGDEQLVVAVRLSAEAESSEPVPISEEGELILDSMRGRGGDGMLHPNHALVFHRAAAESAD